MRPDYIPIPIVASLTAGIALGDIILRCYDLYLIITAFALLTINLLLYARPKYRYENQRLLLIMVNTLIFGILSEHTTTRDITIKSGNATAYGHIERYVKEKENRQSTIFEADSLIIGNTIYYNVEGTAYFNETSDVVRPGEYMAIQGRVEANKRDKTKFRFYTWRHRKDSTQHEPLATLIYNIREWTESSLEKTGFDRGNIGLLLALLMGDKSKIEYETQMEFSDCGIVHILAVSGMHVGIIYIFLSYLIKTPLKRFPHWGSITTIILLWIYAIIAGLAPSIVRATLMMTIYELVRLGNNKPNSITTLYMTLFFILAFNPEYINSVGLWLSFLAVWGILTFYPHLQKLNKINFLPYKYVYNTLALSIAAQTATTPVALYVFDSFPNLFLLSNLLTVPLIAPIIIGAIIVLFIATISTTVASVIAIPIDMMLTFICTTAEWLSSKSYSTTTNMSFSGLECTLLLVTIFLFSEFLRNKEKRHAIYTLISMSILVTIGYIK